MAADHILGEVSFIRRQPGEWSLTTELTLDFVGGLVAPGSVLQVKGSAVRLESKSGFVSGAITDGAGTPVVLATTRIVNVLGEPEMTPPAQPQALIAGSAKIDASLEENLSISYVAGADGLTARLSEPAAWTNGFRILHGGVWACVAEAVASTAVATTNDGLSTAHMHVSYLRPGVPAAGINATADVVHVGGRFALVSVRGYADDGTLCTVASITFRRIEPSIS
ncbi:hotdog domain-containing protein [Mycolicibacterium sp. lyk4-40-TYG-92]|uniref:PaaI family thioesterase n=1 Tax=Mycolicibacterium sp. lyk4-40-TYG-92 TaxID=3040295 RepID=UPI00254B78A7|nr:hotdog domain-containing protein [Mycolicibacterium sp. lyk4-40-TYG-92]